MKNGPSNYYCSTVELLASPLVNTPQTVLSSLTKFCARPSKLEILLSFVVQTGHHDLIAPIETALLQRLEAQLKKVLSNSFPNDGPLEWLEKLRAPLVPGLGRNSISSCLPF